MNSILIKSAGKFNLSKDLVEKWALEVLKKYGLSDCELSIAFVDSKKIRSLNKNYRQLDKATSILSFFQGQAAPENIKILGDVVICPPEAEKKNLSIKFLIDHGIRNLLSEISTSKSQGT